MALKLESGSYVLNSSGLPEKAEGLVELLQNALLRLTLPQGSFPYGRELGSRLGELKADENHREERALALANEALLEMPGVRAKQVEFQADGAAFTLSTPLGEGVVIYGDL